MTTLTVLQEARKLISSESRWTQDHRACLSGGSPTEALDPVAVKFSLDGACFRAAGGKNVHWMRSGDVLRSAMPKKYSGCVGVVEFNEQRSYSDVIAVLDAAIEKATADPQIEDDDEA